MSNHSLITLHELEAAAAGLAGVAVRTPLLPVDALSERFPSGVFVKPEMLQRTGAFKFRGAYNFISNMVPADRERGVIAPSSGNHGQAVAYVARMYGVPCTVVVIVVTLQEQPSPLSMTHHRHLAARLSEVGGVAGGHAVLVAPRHGQG